MNASTKYSKFGIKKMDRDLKIVYEHVYVHDTGYHETMLNGLHPAAVNYIQQFSGSNRSIHSISEEIQSFNESSTWSCLFRHANFLGYTRSKYQNQLFISVDKIQDDDTLYLYPIELGTTIIDLISDNKLTIKDTTYSYTFIDTINSKVLEYLRTGKVKLLINLIHDPLETPKDLILIESYLNTHGIDPSNAVIIAGNNYQDYYKHHPEGKIKITSGFVALGQPAVRMDSYPNVGSLGYESDMIRISDLDKSKIRPKKFLCFNRIMRPHRYVLAYFAFKYNLLENSIFSFIMHNINEYGIRNNVNALLGFEPDIDFCKKINKSLPIEVDTFHLAHGQKNRFTSNNNKKELYASTYFHIISETSFGGGDSRYPFFSEKTFHPLVNLQPFIFVGNPFSLKTLKDLGFKTFHPYIDETYDQVIDPVERFKLIEKEIAKLAALPHEELHKLYYKLSGRTIHNQNTLRKYNNHYPFETALNDIRKFYK